VRSRVLHAIRSHLAPVCEDCGPLEFVSCRLALKGRTPLHRRLHRITAEMQGELEVPVGTVTARIEKADVETRPAIELEELARGGGLPATLARLLLDLEAGAREPATATLVDTLVHNLGDVWEARPYLPLNHTADAERPADAAPDESSARRILLDQGLVLLDELLAQKEGA